MPPIGHVAPGAGLSLVKSADLQTAFPLCHTLMIRSSFAVQGFRLTAMSGPIAQRYHASNL